MPYRCNVPLVSACKLSVQLRNVASIYGGGDSTSHIICVPRRPPADVVMNSTYYHHQCYRRNGWMRGSSAPQLTTSANTRYSEFFHSGTGVDQRLQMTMSSYGHQWPRVFHGGSTFRNDRSGSTSDDAAANDHQHRSEGFSSFWRARSISLDDDVRFRSTEPARWNYSCVNQAARQPDFLSSGERELRAALNRVRQWKYTEAGLAHVREQQLGRQHDAVEFSVASYNVLAQCLLEDNVAHLYPYCRSEHLAWENRRQKLMDEFRRTDADILCLQEVQCDHYGAFFLPQLVKLGYKGFYKQRTGAKKDGCAIFFRERLFEIDRSALIEYWRPGMSILNRDNVALVAVLRAKRTKLHDHDGDGGDDDGGMRLCVANTHLLFNPGRGDIRLAQTQILFAELDRMAFWKSSKRTTSDPSGGEDDDDADLPPSYHPIIVCGDMNSQPHCHLYTFISTGSLEYEGLAAGDISGENSKRKSPKRWKVCLEKELVPSELGITDQCQYLEVSNSRRRKSNDPAVFSSGLMTHGLNLVSVYGHRIDDAQPEVTTHHDRASCTVDYIFYSVKNKHSELRDDRVVHEQIDEGRLNLLATYALPSSDELRSIGGLPNAILASDHVQLVAKFLLKKK